MQARLITLAATLASVLTALLGGEGTLWP